MSASDELDYPDEDLYEDLYEEATFRSVGKLIDLYDKMVFHEAHSLASLDHNLLERITEYLSCLDVSHLLLVCKPISRLATVDFWYRRLHRTKTTNKKLYSYVWRSVVKQLFRLRSLSFDKESYLKMCRDELSKLNFFTSQYPIRVYINPLVQQLYNKTVYFVNKHLKISPPPERCIPNCFCKNSKTSTLSVYQRYCHCHKSQGISGSNLLSLLNRLEEDGYVPLPRLSESCRQELGRYCQLYPLIFKLM